MALKTNKSFTKRLKVTRNGKLVGRRPGQNHFNAKASRSKQRSKGRTQNITLSSEVRNRVIPYK